MANQDVPRGFWPVRHFTGGEIRTHRYKVGGTVYAGDMVELGTAGTVTAAAADNEDNLGVAASYAKTTDADPYVDVYDDPMIVFGGQCSDASFAAIANVGENANILATAGATYSVGYDPYHANLNGYSKMEVGAVAASTASLKILGLIDRPDNAYGLNADVEFLIGEHYMNSAGANQVI
jgi:hypothetical protein